MVSYSVRIERNQAEAQRHWEDEQMESERQNAFNGGIAILAAALAGPDWAGVFVEDPIRRGWRR